MGIFALDSKSEKTFAARPEIQMDMQVGVDDGRTRTYYLVLGSRLAIHFDEAVRERLAEVVSIINEPTEWDEWAGRNPISLTPIPDEGEDRDQVFDALYTIFTGFPSPPRPLGPPAAQPLPPPPARPAYVYGHLPFGGQTGANDVYYRYESFPTSRRILQQPMTIAPGTYAAPASELPFMPTGLSAVARQALPSLIAARWRWELQPVPRTRIRFGASVPLYGQSGGGVEVRFEGQPAAHKPAPAHKRGPIANPVFLPVL
jgi:hypothetical protein